MKSILIPSTLFLILTGMIYTVAGQSYEIQNFKEHMEVFTDRNVYITGEKIYFAAYLLYGKDSGDTIHSKVFYLEIITPDGKSVTGGKFLFGQSSGYGCLTIPEDMLTGNYFAKAYTRYMRNEGTMAYCYVPLKIINPASREVLAITGKNGNTGIHTEENAQEDLSEISCIYADKEVYGKRSSVNLEILSNELLRAGVDHVCITVVPELSLNKDVYNAVPGEAKNSILEYYPETRGISLTGKLVEKQSGKPVQDAEVTLSVFGLKDINAMRSDARGKFHFLLPEIYGKQDIFLCAEDPGGQELSILVDNDYCRLRTDLPAVDFNLDEKEKDMVYKLAVNAQVNHQYQVEKEQPPDSQLLAKKSFYGEPTEVLLMDKYIQLPTLQEYFIELPLDVRIRERQGRKFFKFYSEKAEMIMYDPLVLVDWIAIKDMSKILAIAPEKVARIEIVDQPYVKGNMIYGGIISIISKEGDFAGVDIPSSGLFLNYDFLTENCSSIPTGEITSYDPDPRNTLFWMPFLQINPGKATYLSFTTSDTPGRYQVLVRGIDQNGKIISGSASFEVTGNQ
jgi:hypothetical protein